MQEIEMTRDEEVKAFLAKERAAFFETLRAAGVAEVEAEFSGSGRIASNYVTMSDQLRRTSQWVVLSDKAHEDAAAERKARAERAWANKNYMTTEEKQVEALDSYEE